MWEKSGTTEMQESSLDLLILKQQQWQSPVKTQLLKDDTEKVVLVCIQQGRC